jgi:hypothetical protein
MTDSYAVCQDKLGRLFVQPFVNVISNNAADYIYNYNC